MYRITRFALCSAMLLMCACGLAQRGGQPVGGFDSGGTRVLHVRISLADGPPAQGILVVRLQSDAGTTIAQTTTSNGVAIFSNLAVGHYRLQVSGPSIEDYTSGSFEIGSIESYHEEYVVVRPKTPGLTNPASGGLVTPADLKAPASAREAYFQGNDALIRRDYKKAIQQFQKAIAAYPHYASAHGALGLALLRGGKRKDAGDEFRRAVELDDKQQPAYFNLGKMSLEDGAYGDSEKFLTRAVALAPSDPDAISYLADAQFFEGKYDEVVAAAHKLHAMNPRHPYAATHFLAATALERMHQSEQAAVEYRLFLSEDPSNRRAPLARDALVRLAK
jgi:Flp pilus assembly protein TadD